MAIWLRLVWTPSQCIWNWCDRGNP